MSELEPQPQQPTPAVTSAVVQTPARAEDVEYLKWLMTAIVVVLFVGFAGCFVTVCGIMIDAFNGKREAYDDLTRQVYMQNQKIEKLNEAISRTGYWRAP